MSKKSVASSVSTERSEDRSESLRPETAVLSASGRHVAEDMKLSITSFVGGRFPRHRAETVPLPVVA